MDGLNTYEKIMSTTWIVIFGVFAVMVDHAVVKGGVPTLKEMVTPTRKVKQEIVIYDKIQRIGEYYIPVSDTIHFCRQIETK